MGWLVRAYDGGNTGSWRRFSWLRLESARGRALSRLLADYRVLRRRKKKETAMATHLVRPYDPDWPNLRIANFR